MANRKDIEAGKAHVTIYAKDSPLMKGLSAISGKVTAWGKGLMVAGGAIAGIGAGITSAFVGALSIFADMGSELDDMATKTGVAASSLAELKFAAEQSGTSLESVEKALIAMSKKGLDPKNFDKYAAEIAALPPGLKQVHRAMEVFGKSGADLIPMLAELQQLRQEARDLGLVPTDQAIKDAAKLGDAWDKLRSVISASIFEIGAALAPVLLPALKATVQIAAGVSKWIQKNQGLVRILAAIGVALIAVGTVVAAIGAGFIAAGAVISGITATVSTLGTILTAILSPIGLVVIACLAIDAAIVAAVVAWLRFTESGKATLRILEIGFQQVMKAIKGIGDALMAGDIELAAKIAATGMKLAFFSAIDEILDRILLIPKAIIDAMRPIAEFDPTGKLRGSIALADAAMQLLKFGTGTGTTKKELDELIKRAEEARKRSEQSKDYDTNQGGVLGEMKSLGSFNPYALTLQNWGKGNDNPNAKLEKWLELIFGGVNRNTDETVSAIERATATWGE